MPDPWVVRGGRAYRPSDNPADDDGVGPREDEPLHTEAVLDDNGMWWPANQCPDCLKRYAPWGVGVPVQDAANHCWGHDD